MIPRPWLELAMRYPQALIPGTFLRRYQRFFADVRLEDGTEVVAHCPNTGSMLGINEPGARCLVEPAPVLPANRSRRKLAYTLEAIRVGRIWVGAHPLRANKVGREALEEGMVRGVRGIRSMTREVSYGKSSRADWVVTTRRGAPWVVEIKSASMAIDGVSMFPDAVTDRGLKHLNELLGVVERGGRALMLFVATRHDVREFRAAAHIHAEYAQRLAQVASRGVTVRAITTRVTRRSMVPVGPIPIVFE